MKNPGEIQQNNTIAMEKQSFENEYARFWVDNGILYFVYKEKADIDLEAAKKIVADRLNFQNGVDYPVICEVTNVKNMEKPARDFMANKGSEGTLAVAVIVGSPMTKLMANFYLTINKPVVPTKTFTDYQSAKNYLKELF